MTRAEFVSKFKVGDTVRCYGSFYEILDIGHYDFWGKFSDEESVAGVVRYQDKSYGIKYLENDEIAKKYGMKNTNIVSVRKLDKTIEVNRG